VRLNKSRSMAEEETVTLRPTTEARSALMLTLVLLLPAVLGGCTSDYWRDRGLDLYDTLPCSVAGGHGLTLEFRATQFVGLGIGWADDWRLGMDNHRFGPVWWEQERGIPVWRYYRYQDYLGSDRRWLGGNPRWWPEFHRFRAQSLIFAPGMAREGEFADWYTVTHRPVYVPYPYTLHVPWIWPQWEGWSLLDVEVGVFLGVAGTRVAVSPLQFFDFFFGLFGADLADDDPRKPRAPIWPEYGAPSPFPPGPDTLE